MYLAFNSTFSILPQTTVHWENNHANSGGAIEVHDSSFTCCDVIAKYLPREACFFQLPGQNLSKGLNVQLVFENNSADDAGKYVMWRQNRSLQTHWPEFTQPW